MFLYFFVLYIASLFNKKARLLVRGQSRTLSLLADKVKSGDRWIWFHAASVGEFEQGRPIIERLRKEQPDKKILLTFFSPSGYELRKDYDGVDLVAYLPFATRRNASRFLSVLKPEKAVFIKYEFWPAYLNALKKAGTPTYLISAIFNPKQAFFKWWGGAYRQLLTAFTLLFVQDEASRQLLEKYNITNVEVAGDTRFDRVVNVAEHAREDAILEAFVSGSQSVIVAGSTWPQDEKLLARFLTEHQEVKMVVVPHEIHLSHLQQIFQMFKGRYVLYSQATRQSVEMTRCLVVDTIGMLSEIYRYATVAYIGGGFGVGIHNTLEAATYGKPILFGPNYQRFREARGLIEHGAAVSINSYKTLEASMLSLLSAPQEAGKAAREYVESELGATDKIYSKMLGN